MASGPHSHYSQAIQDLVTNFQTNWDSWDRTNKWATKDNMIRLDSLQKAWDMLAKARREETGYATYLTSEQYIEATKK
jgi:hypothetical protein